MDFEAFTEDIRRNHWNVYGVEVYENSRLIHRWGDTEQTLYEIYSATKTVLSTAFGIACDRGRISPADPLLKHLPKDRLARIPPACRNAFEKIDLHRLLTMSVPGFPFRPEGENWLDFALDCEIPDPGERVFHYNNVSAYLVGVALTHALGEDLGGFVEREVFGPLRIEKYAYSRCPDGYFYGASGMKLTVSGLSRIGLMLINGGTFEGRRILSGEYVRAATSVQQPNREGGYGYFIWKYRNGFSINGKWNQRCYCLPESGLVVTYLSRLGDNTHGLLTSMERNIMGL